MPQKTPKEQKSSPNLSLYSSFAFSIMTQLSTKSANLRADILTPF